MKKLSIATILCTQMVCSLVLPVSKLYAPFGRILWAIILLTFLLSTPVGASKSFVDPGLASAEIVNAPVTILVDDFKPRPFLGSTNTNYFYNRLNGDRGALNNSNVQWGDGFVKATISAGKTTW